MKVYEAVKQYRLDGMNKRYKDQYGCSCDTTIPLSELADKTVKCIKIYPFINEAEIHIVK